MTDKPLTYEQARAMLSIAMKVIGSANKGRTPNTSKDKLLANLAKANEGRKNSKRLGRPKGSKNKPKQPLE